MLPRSRPKPARINGSGVEHFEFLLNLLRVQNPSIMITLKRLLSKAALAVCVTFPQGDSAEDSTAANVLEWSVAEQESYFQTSVTMIAIVATQTGEHGHIAKCVDGWMGGGEQSVPRRAERIRTVMEEIPHFHPQAVILAVVQDACGDF